MTFIPAEPTTPTAPTGMFTPCQANGRAFAGPYCCSEPRNLAATLESEVFSLREWHVLPGRKLIFPGTDETGVYCNLAGTGLLETSFTAEHTAQLPSNETILAPKGHVSDPKRDAAVQFARKVIETCGEVDRRAGGHVLPDKLFNNVFDPERDFRAVRWLVRSDSIRSHRPSPRVLGGFM